MKTIKNVILFLFFINLGYSQNNCFDFQNRPAQNAMSPPAGFGGNAPINTTPVNAFDNWWVYCAQLMYTNGTAAPRPAIYPGSASIAGLGDIYLFVFDNGCSNQSSWVYNPNDFNGNWLSQGNCLCYDFNVLANNTNNATPPTNLKIFQGTDPVNATRSATFVLNNVIQPGSGWTNICPPIAPANASGNLPSNATGSWVMDNGGTSADWNNLITNVQGVAFKVDIGGGSEAYGLDNICLTNCPNLPSNDPPICCQTPLDLKYTKDNHVANVPNGAPWSQNVPLSLTDELFEITQNNVIPITELRVSILDFDFSSDIEECMSCVNNPGHWASLGHRSAPWDKIGSGSSSLQATPPYNPILGDKKNQRELIWENPNGAILNAGDEFSFNLIFPAFSKIPCCVTNVNVCYEISWKDANCNMCTVENCTSYNLGSDKTTPGTSQIDIKVENEGCCDRRLTAIANGALGYSWSNGANTSSIVVSKNGTYSVTATVGGNSVSKSIVVSDIMSGDFPLLSFNSRFHPDLVRPYKEKFYIMDLSPGKWAEGVPNCYNANEYKLEIWHRWNTQGGQGNPLKVITGKSSQCSGFNNWDIAWDGTDQNGVSLKNEKADSYVWRLTLKNCTKESSRMTYRTTFNPKCECEEYAYLFPRRKKVRLWCKKWKGCWRTESFEYGDVQMTT